jgi:hypothetical protein
VFVRGACYLVDVDLLVNSSSEETFADEIAKFGSLTIWEIEYSGEIASLFTCYVKAFITL